MKKCMKKSIDLCPFMIKNRVKILLNRAVARGNSMKTTIFFVHTIRGVEDLFASLSAELIEGEIGTYHIVDESLIRRILVAGGLKKETRHRFCENVIAAEQAGADIIQVTCSTVTPAVALARTLVDVPVLPADEAVVRRAVDTYSKIGVIATNPATLSPSTELVRQMAAGSGKTISVDPVLCEGAYEALLWGDSEKHDALVLDHLRGLIDRVEVVVLAQASMTRITELLGEHEKKIPLLSSPRPAVEELARQVAILTETQDRKNRTAKEEGKK